MKLSSLWKTTIAYAITASMVLSALPVYASTSSEISSLTEEDASWITFTEDSATVSGKDGASAEGTTVTINASGSYVFDGSCSNGNIVVAKNSGDVNIYLNGLSLTEPDEGSCPIETKGSASKGTAANLTICAVKGSSNTLSDANHSEAKPKAAVSASGNVTLTGKGNLTVNGNNKNGIKSDADLSIDSEANVNVMAVDNGIAADGKIVMAGGNIKIKTTNGDALRSCPDELLDSDGTVLVDTTSSTATAEQLAQAVNGSITITGGNLMVSSGSDAIQADNDLTITGGTFSLTTNGGYQTKIASTDTNSYKGLKAADELSVTGGTFYINTADDAIHSNAYAYLTGGSFEIKTGDDAVHADTTLAIGEENASNDELSILIDSAYEGLEAGTVYVYSGTIKATTSDDGMNAAGGSSSSDSFSPGGGFGPGRQGGQGNPSQNTSTSTDATDYTLNFYGGNVYLNTEGDGIDSNGSIYIKGGQLIVFGSSNGGNAAIDYGDSSACVCEISGGTLFAAGQLFSGKAVTPTGGTQAYKSWTQTYASGSIISISYGNTVVFSISAPKKVTNVIYSDSNMTSSSSSYSCASASVSKADPSDDFDEMEITLPTWFDDDYTVFEENNDEESGENGNQSGGNENQSGGNENQSGGNENQSGENENQSGENENQSGGSESQSGRSESQSGGSENQSSGSENQSNDTSGSVDSSINTSVNATDKVGSTFVIKGLTYQVSKIKGKKGNVKLIKASSTKTSFKIPATVKHKGVTYKVTSIGAKAFYKHKKLKSVIIGKNVSQIGTKAFYGCKKLSKITIKTKKLKKKYVGSKAFSKISKKARIRVPKSKLKSYRKIRGLKKAVK